MIVRRRSVPRALVAALTVIAACWRSLRRWPRRRRRPGSSGGHAPTPMRLPRAGSARPTRRRSTTAIRAEASRRSPSRVCPRRTRRIASARCSSTTAGRAATPSPRRRPSAPTSSARSTTASTSSRSTRAASARARPRSTARSTRRPQGLYSAAVHDAREPRRGRAARPRTSAYVKRCVAAQQGDPAVRLDRQRRARHGRASATRWATRSSTTSASPTARSSARPTRASSRTTTARWCSTAPVDANGYINRPEAGLREQSAGFERALGRFFQACAAGPGRLPVRRRRPVGGLRRARRRRPTCSPIPAPGCTDDPRPVNGDDILNGTLITLYTKGNWPLLAQALTAASQGDAHAHALPRRRRPGATTTTARSTRAPTATSRSARIEQKLPARRRTLPRGRRQLVGHVRPLLAQLGLRRAPRTRSGRSSDKDAFPGPFTRVEVGADGARGRDDLRPGDAVPRRQAARDAARQRPLPDDGRRRPHGVPERLADLHRLGHPRLHRDARRSRPRARSARRSVPFVQPPPAAASATSRAARRRRRLELRARCASTIRLHACR